MSIHTILSQEIEKFHRICTPEFGCISDGKEKIDVFFNPIQLQKNIEQWIRSFATRIVEEAQREIVICAAIVDSNNRVFRGHRHHDAIHAMSTRPGTAHVVEEGFITSKNRFVGRREAMDIQIAAGKMAKSNKGVDLFSEDLY